MLAIAISLLFGLAAFAAIAVIHASLIAAAGRARRILAELAEIDCRAGFTAPTRRRPQPALRPLFAAA